MTTGAGTGRVSIPPAGGRPRRRDFPGWRMVWVLAATETVGYAALFYCFAVMVVPMRADRAHNPTGKPCRAVTPSGCSPRADPA